MTVVAGWFAGRQWKELPNLADLAPALQQAVQMGSALNSKARLSSTSVSLSVASTPGFPPPLSHDCHTFQADNDGLCPACSFSTGAEC